MFESNEDIVLDENDEFLNGVFGNEQENFGNVEDKPSFHRTQQQQPIFLVGGRNQRIQTPVDNQLVNPTSHVTISHMNAKQGPRPLYVSQPGRMLQETEENKRKFLFPPTSTKRKRERRFPGPAGLLPDRKSSGFTPLKIDSLLEADKSPTDPSTDDFCSQGRCSGSILEEEPWQNLLLDLGPDKAILDEVNVASVKRKAAAKCFTGRKVPFLAAVLHHLDVSSPDPCIILRDSSGEIHGTLHREVWEKFAGELGVGSVLVIRNVGLLSTGTSSRRHYLNITANNLATIYSANPDKLRKTWLHPLSSQDLVQTIQNWRTLVSTSNGVGSPASLGSHSLFNSSLTLPMNNSLISSTSNASINSLPRRTEVNQKLNITPLRSSLRETVTSAMRFSENFPMHSVPPKAVGKNLLHSLLSNVSPTSSHSSVRPTNNKVTNLTQSVCRPKPFINENSANSIFNNNSNFVSSTVRSTNQQPQKHSSANSFKFDPVIVRPKKFVGDNYPQTNSDRQSGNNKQLDFNKSVTMNNTEPRATNNNSVVLLSQTSQLTAEEQSLVENVFDGVDVDSIFDDEF